MAKTPSTMTDLGTVAPDFKLPDTSGLSWSLKSCAGDAGTLVMFICNHCPYVLHIKGALSALARKYQDLGIGIVAINANDVKKYPDDHPDKMKLFAQENAFSFPYLFDETQSVAKAYRAACTPDFFLYDRHFKLVYRGQFDDSRPGNDKPVTGHDLSAACDSLLAGRRISDQQIPSIGCNIKWKPGNEPDFYLRPNV